MKTIFDIGSGNGDNIPYYLMKADKVIAFEANPVLCQQIADRFVREMDEGRVAIEAGVLCAEADADSANVDFYIHNRADVLSRFPKPAEKRLHNYTKVTLPITLLSSALHTYGTPHYAKIDIEFYDHVILSEFFRLNAYPDYISAECQSFDVVSLLTKCPHYTGFKLLDSSAVQSEYRNVTVKTLAGAIDTYTFPHHSAGPFGEDLNGRWCDRKSMFRSILSQRLGWKDLHASRVDAGERLSVRVSFADYLDYAKQTYRVLRGKAPKASHRY